MSVRILVGDCRERMRELPDASVDSCVTDPPYHLTSIVKRFGSANAAPAKGNAAFVRASKGFMGQQWDGGDVAFKVETWAEVLRVLKPGGFVLAFGGTRTFHRLACAIEDAGFEIRDTLSWNFGSGFPKSHNISKALASLPFCTCTTVEVPDDLLGGVDASAPLSLGGAGVGAERVAVLGASAPALADGLGLEPRPETLRRQSGVQGDVEHVIGHLDPEVLGPLDVAASAQRQQVPGDVRGIKIEPEALRNEVVGDQAIQRPAVGAAAIALNHEAGEFGPTPAFVSPLLAAPSGVAVTDHPASVVGRHAGAGAIGSRPSADEIVSLEGRTARSASKVRHGQEDTTKSPQFKCAACGGVKVGDIPDGLGTALKPAMELICMARKPLAERNIAANVLAHGTGALNIDGCRVPTSPADAEAMSRCNTAGSGRFIATPATDNTFGRPSPSKPLDTTIGRWPANIVHDGSDEVLAGFPEAPGQGGSLSGGEPSSLVNNVYGARNRVPCANPRNDSGSAARFFYSAKTDPTERHAGCEDLAKGNHHPTVKPIDLMRWLCRLVTPKGGTVLDPFCGSGSTLIAADAEQFHAIGCELSPDYAAIAERRLRAAGGMFLEMEAA